MMKRTIAIAALASLPMSVVMADDDIGCGLGTQIWEGQSGLIAKVLGATTNGTSGNQTFGITSGTLGCSQDGVITASARVPMFASANVDQLAAEVAAGEGEALDALAALYEIDGADRQAFNALAQSNFDRLFGAADVTTGSVIAELEATMAADARFAQYLG